MAKTKQEIPIKKHFCGDCAEITETYNKGADGKDILGTCRLDGYAKLLKYGNCKHLKLK